jgi:3-dehydroquinate dehydratase
MTTILVLHGPNMALKGVDAIDETLEGRAVELGVDLLTFRGSSEGALLDELLRQYLEIDALIINPGLLAPAAWSLAEALGLVKKPSVEVLLTPLPTERGPSALAAVVRAQVHDQSNGGYVAALELLVRELGVKPPAPDDEETAPLRARSVGSSSARAEKSIGRRRLEPESTEDPGRTGKTIGRKVGGTAPVVANGSLTRAVVREKLKARLGGSLSADALAGWARSEWSKLNSGGPCDEASRALLDGVLLTVMGGAKATDAIVLAQLARLEQ